MFFSSSIDYLLPTHEIYILKSSKIRGIDEEFEWNYFFYVETLQSGKIPYFFNKNGKYWALYLSSTLYMISEENILGKIIYRSFKIKVLQMN